MKIIGFDLGVGSIGTTLRNTENGSDIIKQIEYFSSDVFGTSLTQGNNGEVTKASARSSSARLRRLYDTRRQKLWATLHLLLEYKLCPMKEESLMQWERYDKEKGYCRKYPQNDVAFNNWIKLDFDGDGKVDYSSPFQLRDELVTTQLDFGDTINRYKLGRALYHIAQHRGFKSSRGETIAAQEAAEASESTASIVKQESEEKKSQRLCDYIKEHALRTVGSAFAHLEKEGKRIRGSENQAVRLQLMEEIKEIFHFQKGLCNEETLLKRLISTKKGEGTIFYKKPLRSQKGAVGKCTLETNKRRCPLSHPEYEKFRAWQIINNIKIKINGSFEELPVDTKQKIYTNLFVSRVKPNFSFSEVRAFLNKELSLSMEESDINYKDYQTIAGCPITARLRKLLGEDWENWSLQSDKEHNGRKTKSKTMHKVCYDAYDLWSFCFQADEKTDVVAFAKDSLRWDDERANQLSLLWENMVIGYAHLSLKAIRNINKFLILGCGYADAVLLAKIPDIVSLTDQGIHEIIYDYKTKIKPHTIFAQNVYGIVNSLIGQYKSQIASERFADHDTSYTLKEDDIVCVRNEVEKNLKTISDDERLVVIQQVTSLYQSFFHSIKREKYPMPTLGNNLKEYLKKQYPNVEYCKWDKLYHPSQIDRFMPVNAHEAREKWRLGYPSLGAIKNPLVLQVLNILKNKVNYMLDKGIIDYNTRVVIETTREEHDTNELNDANKRKAWRIYQKTREDENKAIENFLRGEFGNLAVSKSAIKKVRYGIEQLDLDEDTEDVLIRKEKFYGTGEKGKGIELYEKLVKHLKEQDFTCMYTGKVIPMSCIFNENEVDFEHTVPRSLFPTNADTNLTVCDAYYNRHIKKNQIPTQLPNYDRDVTINGIIYTAIKPRLRKWKKRVEELEKRVDYWKAQSHRAQEKKDKDYCIQQRHLWAIELEYWRTKLQTFTITEVEDRFSNKALVDTSIITKYAIAFLKSVFTRVDAQKGSVTAEFRKILGIQNEYEKKSRAMHSHHAIDAAILTLIPFNAKRRDQMIKLFYKIKETKELVNYEEDKQIRSDLQLNLGYYKAELNSLKEEFGFNGKVAEIIERINDNILINRHAKDNTLSLAKKNIRKRGKKVYKKKGNESIFLQSDGDSIRAKLHLETFYGAIKLPEEDKELGNGYLCKDGHFVYGEDSYTMVVRKKIGEIKKDKDIEMIIDPVIRKRISDFVAKNSFSKLATAEIFMLDKDGNEIREDKNGRSLCPIRHVRCKALAGRNLLKHDTAKKVKQQTNASSKQMVNIDNRDYKKYYYAQNADVTYLLLYENETNGKTDIAFKLLYAFDLRFVAKSHVVDAFDYFKNDSNYATVNKAGKTYHLTALLRKGTRLLLWKNSPEELYDMTNQQLNKRLFELYKFGKNNGSVNLHLNYHLDASVKNDQRTPRVNESYKYFEFSTTIGITKLKCCIEHRDFEIDKLGNIIFNNRNDKEDTLF